MFSCNQGGNSLKIDIVTVNRTRATPLKPSIEVLSALRQKLPNVPLYAVFDTEEAKAHDRRQPRIDTLRPIRKPDDSIDVVARRCRVEFHRTRPLSYPSKS